MSRYVIPENRFKGFYHFHQAVSTMYEAESFIEKGISRGIVLADSQTGGYGRNDKPWFSPENGNIYITFFEKSDVKLVPQRVAMAAFNTVSAFSKADSVKIKWPNDILISGKKVCGIIAKSLSYKNKCFFLAGIGMNVYLPDADTRFEWEAGTLNGGGISVSTGDVLKRLIIETDKAFCCSDQEVIEKFKAGIQWMKGRKIRFTQDKIKFYDGVVTGFGEEGSSIKIDLLGEEKEYSTLSISGISDRSGQNLAN